MFKVKSWTVNPIHVVCITLLITIIVLLVSGKPADSNDSDIPSNMRLVPARSYQIQLTLDGKGHDMYVLYDGDRLIGTTSLDRDCNLNKLIEMGND